MADLDPIRLKRNFDKLQKILNVLGQLVAAKSPNGSRNSDSAPNPVNSKEKIELKDILVFLDKLLDILEKLIRIFRIAGLKNTLNALLKLVAVLKLLIFIVRKITENSEKKDLKNIIDELWTLFDIFRTLSGSSDNRDRSDDDGNGGDILDALELLLDILDLVISITRKLRIGGNRSNSDSNNSSGNRESAWNWNLIFDQLVEKLPEAVCIAAVVTVGVVALTNPITAPVAIATVTSAGLNLLR